MSNLPVLSGLLNYKNPLVIKRFKRNFPQYQARAESLFIDMLKYLWLSMKHDHDKSLQLTNEELDFSCVMHHEMAIIDEMWHTFILITKDYADFCQRYFGTFLHHTPEVGEHAEDYAPLDKEKFQRQLELFLSYVYDQLGEETVRSWFAVYVMD